MMNYVVIAIKLFAAYYIGDWVSAAILFFSYCDDELFELCVINDDRPVKERVEIFLKKTGLNKWAFWKWHIAISLVILVLIELVF